jgi:hypothetical protein
MATVSNRGIIVPVRLSGCRNPKVRTEWDMQKLNVEARLI